MSVCKGSLSIGNGAYGPELFAEFLIGLDAIKKPIELDLLTLGDIRIIRSSYGYSNFLETYVGLYGSSLELGETEEVRAALRNAVEAERIREVGAAAFAVLLMLAVALACARYMVPEWLEVRDPSRPLSEDVAAEMVDWILKLAGIKGISEKVIRPSETDHGDDRDAIVWHILEAIEGAIAPMSQFSRVLANAVKRRR